jgi:N-acetylneuraminate synthase/N,N'-diacetyllegionaminate synthase
MKIDTFDLAKEVLIVAEIGNNHEGSYGLAEEMIGLAAQAGAGAVKFQTIVPEKLISPKQKNRIQQLEKFRFSHDEFEKLSKVAKQEQILFLSTPFDIESAYFLEPLVPAFKIASGDNNFFPMIEVIARTGKPILVSTGLLNFNQIRYVQKHIDDIWKEENINQELAILHCITAYPASPSDLNLLFLKQLQQLSTTVGYSDHSIGIEAAVLSVALGAKIVEKHFTIDKNYSDFHDHKLSADPKEFTTMVRRIRDAIEMLGSGEKSLCESERNILQNVRRSIVAARNLDTGTLLEWNNLTWVRPADGLPPGEEEKLLGKKLKRFIASGEPILLSDVE